jgi:hypothetical protein
MLMLAPRYYGPILSLAAVLSRNALTGKSLLHAWSIKEFQHIPAECRG